MRSCTERKRENKQGREHEHADPTRGRLPYAGRMTARSMTARSTTARDDARDDEVFRVDATSSSPPYRQLHDAVVTALADGRLHPGEKLPTVRALATQLGLAANTVAAAYRALEEAGVVEGRGRAGTFVRLGDDPIEAEARRIALDAVDRLSALGVDGDRAIRILTEAVRAR